jgi:hypothetical protein
VPGANAIELRDSPDPKPVALDDERQAVFVDMTSLGAMLGLPLDPACLSALLIAFPTEHLEFLSIAVTARINLARRGGRPDSSSGYPAPMLPDVADFAYDSVLCVRGNADTELLDAAVASAHENATDVAVDMTCVEAFLSTLPEPLLVAIAENRPLFESEAATLPHDETVEAFERLALMNRLCRPDGREQVGDIMGMPLRPPETAPATSER